MTALTGLRADLPPEVPGAFTCPPTNSDLPRNVLFDFASNNLTVSLTLDLGLGGMAGFVPGDFKVFFTSGVTGVCLLLDPPTPADEALCGEPRLVARTYEICMTTCKKDTLLLTESLSSSLFGREIGLGILDLLPLLVLLLSVLAGLLPAEFMQDEAWQKIDF